VYLPGASAVDLAEEAFELSVAGKLKLHSERAATFTQQQKLETNWSGLIGSLRGGQGP
jgi:hypothetical protein